jgi:hypothetical protein
MRITNMKELEANMVKENTRISKENKSLKEIVLDLEDKCRVLFNDN